MTHTLVKPATCTHCGASARVRAADPATDARAAGRHDLAALAIEAARDATYDETTKARVTQQDIRNLLAKRRKGRK
jgi:hypothetical protein